MPAIALPSEYPHRLRNFGPSDRIGNESDRARPAALVREPLEPQHQLHVLSDGVVQIPSRAQHRFASEKSERARDDDVAAEPIPSESSEQERPQILDYLHASECVDWNARSYDASELHLRSVDDADGAAGRNDVGRVDEWPHHPLQSVGLNESVGVHCAHQLALREAQSDVQCVCLPSILLVDDYERRIARRTVQVPHLLGFDAPLIDRLDRHEIESLLQHLYSSVLRPVVDYDHLKARILESEQGPQTYLNRSLLVERRGENRDSGR